MAETLDELRDRETQALWRLLGYIDGDDDYKSDGRPEVDAYRESIERRVRAEVAALALQGEG